MGDMSARCAHGDFAAYCDTCNMECPQCGGSGLAYDGRDYADCPNCNASGIVRRSQHSSKGGENG